MRAALIDANGVVANLIVVTSLQDPVPAGMRLVSCEAGADKGNTWTEEGGFVLSPERQAALDAKLKALEDDAFDLGE